MCWCVKLRNIEEREPEEILPYGCGRSCGCAGYWVREVDCKWDKPPCLCWRMLVLSDFGNLNASTREEVHPCGWMNGEKQARGEATLCLRWCVQGNECVQVRDVEKRVRGNITLWVWV